MPCQVVEAHGEAGHGLCSEIRENSAGPLETWSLSAMESGGGDFGLCVPVTDSNKTTLN